MKSIKIDHGSKVHVVASIFLETPLYVILHWAESTSSAAMDHPLLASVSNEYRVVQIDPETGQVRNQDFASEYQFRSTLSEQM